MRVTGSVVEEESGRPIQGLRVRAYDKDLLFDDMLGDALTDAAGRFEIRFTEAHFRDLHETSPDLYVRVYDGAGSKLLYTTEDAVRTDTLLNERFEIRIPRATLA